MMHTAILGWGSLDWDPRDLPIVGEWQKGGPILPIEFSRISSDGRLTLVIDETNGVSVSTRFVQSACNNLSDAIDSLSEREGTSKGRIGFLVLAGGIEQRWARKNHPAACDCIKAWALANGWHAVIWTALISNFEQRRRTPFSVPAALEHLNGLAGDQKARALEYFERAPEEVDTPVRRLLPKRGNVPRELRG